MPFFIPIMIAATALSMIPSFLPQQNQAQNVIDRTGRNYYDRQTWRTGNPTWRKSPASRGSGRRPYSQIETDPASNKNAINIRQIGFYIGVGLILIIGLRLITRR